MKIAIIGHGAIAQHVRAALVGLGIVEVAQIVRPGKEAAATKTAPPCISDIVDLPDHADLIVDCGGHLALAAHGPVALEAGIDVLTVSLGALADAAIAATLQEAATRGGARLHLVSGAIGGLDALRAACTGEVSTVVYIGRKPPQGWKGSPAEDTIDLDALSSATTHFAGTARDAALRYPKNANVAAAVALAGLGFEETQVELIADPGVSTNIHEVRATGAFGSLQFTVSGHGLPGNPRSSALAAMSIVAELSERRKRIGF